MTHLWEDQVLPRVLSLALSTREVGRHRAEATRGLAGTVLEIGFGSGLNLPHYPADVGEVLAVEPSDLGWKLSARRVGASATPVRRVGLDGADLPLPDATADAALSTFTLCTLPDATTALHEVRRVLRPGGRLHFLEHGLAPEPAVAARQHRLNGMQRKLFGGCHLDRPIDRLIEAAGFDVVELDRAFMKGPSVLQPWNFLYRGVATPAG